MKLHIISDLHIEFEDYNITVLDTDVIILAGDIGVGLKGLDWAAQQLSRTEAHIIYVAGNHEFYHQEMQSLRKAMKAYCIVPVGLTGDDSKHRLHFLDDEEVVINGVRFLGSMLWTDFKLFGEDRIDRSMHVAKRSLNDFRLIRNGDSNYSPEDSIELHDKSAAWLKNKLTNEKFDGKTVVITHHLPTPQSVAECYKDDWLSACFASDLDYLLGHSELWIHGHTHESFDYVNNGTRVICNPRGYSQRGRAENREFNPNLVVDI